MAEFLYGFGALAAQIPAIVGTPIEDEHWSGNGDSLQATTSGLMVYRKDTNTPAFTDGTHTWLLGPLGLQDRPNEERFDWEQPPAPPEYAPTFIMAPTPSETFPFLRVPKGFCLHGTRSGIAQSLDREFDATVAYAMRGASGMAWNYTVGGGIVAQHVHPKRWGWNARKASQYYIGIEIANPTLASWVTDQEARDVAWCIKETREVWPSIPLYLPTHSELEHLGETGKQDGKSDVVPWWSIDRAEDLRRRILGYLGEV